LLGWLLILAVLAVVGILIWKKNKRKNEITAPTVSPDEAALHKLSKIHHFMAGNGKTFYFRLSLILREYLFDQFGIGAPEMTTEELIPRLDRLRLKNDVKGDLQDFLYTGDLVKFAKVPPVRDDMEAHFKMVRRFIKITAEILKEPDEMAENKSPCNETAAPNDKKIEEPESQPKPIPVRSSSSSKIRS
jgi:hypothetical protein